MDYERPPSDHLVDIHVYLVPLEFWREQLNSAVNQIIDETISVGFIRVYPDSNLQELRREIAQQLSDVAIPTDYTYLRSVGRCLTRVQSKQETQLKAKNYIPPQAYAPEIFILEGAPDNRSSVGHPFSRWSGERSVQNSSDTVRTTRSDGPYKPLPAINNSRRQSPTDQTDDRRENDSDRDHSDHSKYSDHRRPSKSSDEDQSDNRKDNRSDRYDRRDDRNDGQNPDDNRENRWDEDRWEHQPNGKEERSDDPDYRENRYDSNRERTLPPLSASPTHINRGNNDDEDDDNRRENDPTPHRENEDYDGPPLSATPPHSRRSSPKRNRSRSRSTNSRREASDSYDRNDDDGHHDSRSPGRTDSRYEDENKENRGVAWRDSTDIDKDRYEDHSYDDNDPYNRDGDSKGGDTLRPNDPNRRQFSSIQEESADEHQSQYRGDWGNRADHGDYGDNDYRNGSRSPSRSSPRASRRNSKSQDRRESIKDKGQLLRELEESKRERQEVERKREELVKRAKMLQTQTQQKRSQARDIWKKRYFEEKKKTPPLEEQVNRLRNELENLHSRIISQLEVSKEDGASLPHAKPSNFNNLKLQATKASHEITDLQRRVENVGMKLTGEIKLRKQAEVELKALKAELTQKKINLTLTRSQQLNNNSSTLSNSYNGYSTAR